MNLNNLSDNELINYVLKFSTNPLELRLATYMERIKGAIMDDLLDAGMDDSFCTFKTEWGGDRLPGQYIMHLEEEIKIRDDTIAELQEEVEQRKALTIAGLIEELNLKISTMGHHVDEARREQRQAEHERDHAKDRLSMWAKLNGQGI